MGTGTTAVKLPLALASGWCVTTSLSILAVPVLVAIVPNWHQVTQYLHTLSGVQTWVSIAACLCLMLLSKPKHSEIVVEWGKSTSIFIVGGLLTALLLHYGVMPQWLAHSDSIFKQAQIAGLMLLHGACAWITLRKLVQYRRAA